MKSEASPPPNLLRLVLRAHSRAPEKILAAREDFGARAVPARSGCAPAKAQQSSNALAPILPLRPGTGRAPECDRPRSQHRPPARRCRDHSTSPCAPSCCGQGRPHSEGGGPFRLRLRIRRSPLSPKSPTRRRWSRAGPRSGSVSPARRRWCRGGRAGRAQGQGRRCACPAWAPASRRVVPAGAALGRAPRPSSRRTARRKRPRDPPGQRRAPRRISPTARGTRPQWSSPRPSTAAPRSGSPPPPTGARETCIRPPWPTRWPISQNSRSRCPQWSPPSRKRRASLGSGRRRCRPCFRRSAARSHTPP